MTALSPPLRRDSAKGVAFLVAGIAVDHELGGILPGEGSGVGGGIAEDLDIVVNGGLDFGAAPIGAAAPQAVVLVGAEGGEQDGLEEVHLGPLLTEGEREGTEAEAAAEAEGERDSEAVAEGLGLGVVAETAYRPDPRLVKLTISDTSMATQVHFICRKERHQAPLISIFLGLAHSVSQKIA